MNRLISQGHATRSTFAFSLVTHFTDELLSHLSGSANVIVTTVTQARPTNFMIVVGSRLIDRSIHRDHETRAREAVQSGPHGRSGPGQPRLVSAEPIWAAVWQERWLTSVQPYLSVMIPRAVMELMRRTSSQRARRGPASRWRRPESR